MTTHSDYDNDPGWWDEILERDGGIVDEGYSPLDTSSAAPSALLEPVVRRPRLIMEDWRPTAAELNDRESNAFKDGPRVGGVPLLCAGINVVYAPPATGKSWFSTKVSLDCVERGHRVLYCDFEMGRATIERMFQLGMTMEHLDKGLFGVSRGVADVHAPGVDPLQEASKAFFEAAELHKPDLLIVDTLAETFAKVTASGTNENDNTAMARLFSLLHDFFQDTGVPVLIVAHTGKQGESIRGASASEGAARMIYQMKPKARFNPKQDGEVSVECRKDSYGLTSDIKFTMKVKTVGLPDRVLQLDDGQANIHRVDIELTTNEAQVGGQTISDIQRLFIECAWFVTQKGTATERNIRDQAFKGVASAYTAKPKPSEQSGSDSSYEQTFGRLSNVFGITAMNGVWTADEGVSGAEWLKRIDTLVFPGATAEVIGTFG